MKQLSPNGSQMLFQESIDTPYQINPLNIYDQATAPDGKVTFKGILETVRKGLDEAPLFRQKLVRVPLDLDEPYWIDDPNFDLEFHVRHIALPKPGDWRQLCILVSRLISRRLDHSRPMWEMYVIERLDNVEGLPAESFAVLFKIHHTMVADDGNISLLSAIHDFEATPVAKISHTKMAIPWSPKPVPSVIKFVGTSLKKLTRKPGHFLNVARRVAPKMYSLRGLKKTKTPFRVPRSPFNGKLTSNRIFDCVFFDLEDLKRLRGLAQGSTINDVAISIISGAMRSYMINRKHLPRESLVASVPISMHSGRKGSKKEADDVIIQDIPIFTSIEDPAERLKLIGRVMRETKNYIKAVGAKNLSELSSAVPGLVSGLAAQAMTKLSLIAGETTSCNTVITNVPGVQVPLYLSGAQMRLSTTCGPLTGTIGLVNSVSSYCGTVGISFTGCRDLIPDPNVYRDYIQASYQNHLQALSQVSTKSLKK